MCGAGGFDCGYDCNDDGIKKKTFHSASGDKLTALHEEYQIINYRKFLKS